MAIMNALAELHQEPDLKLNLKFEIEVLCKTLNIDLGVSVYVFFYEIEQHFFWNTFMSFSNILNLFSRRN